MLRDVESKEYKAGALEYKRGGYTLSVDGRSAEGLKRGHPLAGRRVTLEDVKRSTSAVTTVSTPHPLAGRRIDYPGSGKSYTSSVTSESGRKYSPEEVAAAMADFRRRYPPKLAARECMPYQEQLDTALRAWQVAVRRLQLEGANLDLRWFDRIETNVTGNVGRGWKAVTCPAAVTSRTAGFYEHQGREVWLSANLEPADVAKVLAHELRHAWQNRNVGPDYFDGYWDRYPDHEAERDAKAFASSFINDGTWTWRNW